MLSSSTRTRERALLTLGASLALLLPFVLLAPGCDPPEDAFIRNGGAAPDPTGVIEGTVLYIGPRPQCHRGADGEATSIIGNVILTLFEYDNPPPPEGSASGAANLMTVSGAELFDLSDCMPTETPDPSFIMRSVDFAWPEIPLGVGEVDDTTGTRPGADYQVRGFFDYDDDFNPFFSVRRLGTAGDVAGGAFQSITETPPIFQRISFGNIEDLPNGQVVQGISVALVAPINTEMPVVRLGDGTHALRSQDTVPISMDREQQEQDTFLLTEAHLSTVDVASEAWQRTLTAAGMIRPLEDDFPDQISSFQTGPTSYGFYVLQVDTDRDGNRGEGGVGPLGSVPEPHPVLGLLGIGNYHPMVIMRRARNPIEAAAGIPTVVILPSPRPSQVEDSDVFDGHRQTFSSDIDLVIPPVAAMFTTPECSIPLIAPRNVAELYASSPSDCQELPTGNYDVNVITGVAGGLPLNYREQVTAENPGATPEEIDAMVAAVTDNDYIIAGGSYSSQAWSIPNELGCPDRNYNPASRNQLDDDESITCTPEADTAMQVSQGPAGRFSVVDHDGTNAPEFDNLEDGHGVSQCQSAFSITELRQVPVTYMDISEECCAPIMHLCNLPLCPLRDVAADPASPDQAEIRAALPDAEGNREIREMRIPGEDYTPNEDGSVTPLCVPFLMPVSCCRRAGMGEM